MTKKSVIETKKILKKIKQQKIKMRPKAYFVMGHLLLGSGIVGALVLGVMLVSMVIFRLRVAGAFEYLRMGGMGLGFFCRVMPWKVAGLAGAGLVGGLWLLKKHDKAYRINIGWLLIGVLVSAGLLGFLVDRLGVNERLGKFKSLRPFYETNLKDKEKLYKEFIEMNPRQRRVKGVKKERWERIQVGEVMVEVEVRDTMAGRVQGLSGVEKLDDDEGMLFVFPVEGKFSFWMKEMKFDLDFVWIKGDKVVGITEGVKAPKQGEIAVMVEPEEGVNMVLEVNSGWVKRNEIKVGDKVILDR